ncbi:MULTISPECIES: hypothetical protein [Clostridium]|uniref:LysM domain-containing protein n=1 Tax=Clostridium carnis TaxID=1530 RepID=A0ABY6SP91_9CLOT|nr:MULTISPECIES: hypothetical protein [Clostridium]CAI3629085.1 LysM domain-containing protein [Clostridium neonatale]CAI3651785.1 LysM domain-containing protein [Clostridium neonatale]CAI3663791.1 LysM domain-containing protein [Clostridium neonatale]CAI3668445.1 LysM domain-containing protein [Clostridium neonatale]CAI3698186.1 LysM domain-containing protein [Clostridium neonatale]
MALQKAKIIVISSNKSNEEKTIPVMFNPSEYKITKNVNYKTTNIQGQKSKKINYKNGEPSTLNVDLFFNGDVKYTAKEELKPEENVRKYTERILELLIPDKDGYPPTCKFIWGKFTFVGYISSATETFTRFTQDGIPIRATVNLTIMEKPDDLTNKRTEKDYESYGKLELKNTDTICNQGKTPDQWRKIAESKGILNPRTLK